MPVTLVGHTYTEEMFTGVAPNGTPGYWAKPAWSSQPLLLALMEDVLAELDGAATILSGGVSPGTQGGMVESTGAVWARRDSPFGAMVTTSGATADWNAVDNTKPGGSRYLLLGSDTNGPTGSNYYHPFNFEYGSKNGSGNVTQFAIPYGNAPTAGVFIRGRYGGAWTGWTKLAMEAQAATFANLTTTGNLLVTGTTASAGAAVRQISANGGAGFLYNVPTGASHVFGVNGVAELTLTATTAVFGSIAVSGVSTLTTTGLATVVGLSTSGNFLLTGTTAAGTASTRWMGAAGNANNWQMNTPSGGLQIFTTNNAAPITMGAWGGDATYGALSFNGVVTSGALLGLFGKAGDNTLYYDAPATHNFRIANSVLAQISGSGLTVIGAGTFSGAAGSHRGINLHTNGVLRWRIAANDVLETGSDAGSNAVIDAFTDAGAYIDTPIVLNRAAGGHVVVNRPLTGNIFIAASTGLSWVNAYASIQRSTAYGLLMQGSTGTTNDLMWIGPGGATIAEVPTGTVNVHFAGVVCKARDVTACASGVATNLFALPAAGMYEIFASDTNGGAAVYRAIAILSYNGTSAVVDQIFGSGLTLDYNGGYVRALQTSGSSQNIRWGYTLRAQ